jgi:hypothetical protein
MTVPLRKEKDEALPDSEIGASQQPTESSEAAPGQERPRLVQSERTGGGEARTMAKGMDEPAANPLFTNNDLRELQLRWDQIQTAFVDQPRNAVHDADALVSSAIQRLSDVFAAERSKLEQQWDNTDSVSTEDLRVALQRYRSFFRRLLSV